MDPRRLYLFNGLMIGFVLGAFGLSAVVWWVVDLELSPIRLVLLGTALELAVLLSESPTGVVADVFSRKWSVVLSWVLIGISNILAPVTTVFPVLLVWQAMFGLGWTFQSGADTAWVTDEIGAPDDSLVLRKAVATSLGLVFGITGAAALSQWSLRGTMAITGVAGLLVAGVLAVTMTEHNFEPLDRTVRSTRSAMVDTWRRGFAVVRGNRVVRILVVATFVTAMVDETVDRLDLARMRELGFPDLDGAGSAALFGGVWVTMTLLTLPVMIVVSRRVAGSTDRTSARLMTGFLALGAIGVGLMAGTVFGLALLGWVIRDVIREVVDPVGEAWVNRHAESEVRATVISFRSQSMAFGEITGGLLLGLVAELVGLQAAFIGAAVLLAVAAAQVGRLLPVGSTVGAGADPGGGS